MAMPVWLVVQNLHYISEVSGSIIVKVTESFDLLYFHEVLAD
jgi:hypothetical protein